MSRFHQLVAGKSGKGPGRGPPRVAGNAAAAASTTTTTSSVRRWSTRPPALTGLAGRCEAYNAWTMCGIGGIWQPGRQVEDGDLRAMAAALAHRGPDDEHMHVEPGLGLVHRRLAILD